MSIPDHLIHDLPDQEAAVQFARRFEDMHPSIYRRLLKDGALVSDVLTLVSYSPLLATTLQQNPDYISWLKRRRKHKGVRGKDELLESLARFSLTNSTLETQVMFARFRRRELLRIYLADIRRQLTVAEITEELSNLADAILESALRIARQELDNRFGPPQETDDRGRQRMATFCVVTLGKLGSRELNYSSDIDLLFLYSAQGETTGAGNRGKVTNREYFVKLAELITKLIGQQTGEGATYRVDLRLRPHGRVGPLAMSVADTVRYYQTEAADWERQVLIRSRSGAGESSLFTDFNREVRPYVYSETQSVGSALRSVRRSKQKIDIEHINAKGLDVKLGKGGIREIEFISQALQLAYGGRDKWLHAPHTLISLDRLADRGLIEDREQTDLFDAYDFLRRLEHVLQMENGLQTHLVPDDPIRRNLVARRMLFEQVPAFDAKVVEHTAKVNRVFKRIFSDENIETSEAVERFVEGDFTEPFFDYKTDSLETTELAPARADNLVKSLAQLSPKFGEFIGDASISEISEELVDYREKLLSIVRNGLVIGDKISALRREWRRHVVAIAALDAAGRINIRESKRRQTQLAEASIHAALEIACLEMEQRTGQKFADLGLAVMGLGKLGGAGIDYDSDLDLVLVFDSEECSEIDGLTQVEFFSRAAEIFVNALSNYTRDGNLYRVDLRLRPHGNNGPNVISLPSFESYVSETAAIWELLAFVKLRAAGGGEFGERVWEQISAAVHSRGSRIPAEELAAETRRVRFLLEKERSKKGNSVNIKYGAGGMLDIYFAIRYLQLRDNLPDTDESRSTENMLEKLRSKGSLSDTNFRALRSGYEFLSALDHAMRLIIGRSHVVPHTGNSQLRKIVARLGCKSIGEFDQRLSLHRIEIRDAFNSVTQ